MHTLLRTSLSLLAATTLLVACSSTNAFLNFGSPTSIYYKDGKPAYVANCSGPSWKSCLEQAGSTCKTVGYTVLEKSAARSYGDETREIVFACNGNPDAPAAEPKAGSAGS
jgi:hypothetical protein